MSEWIWLGLAGPIMFTITLLYARMIELGKGTKEEKNQAQVSWLFILLSGN